MGRISTMNGETLRRTAPDILLPILFNLVFLRPRIFLLRGTM